MAGIIAVMLGGCSGGNFPAWLQIKPPKQSLRFESEPSGAQVRTADGQVCRTPCSLSLPLTAQSANFSLEGYLPQTVPVQVHQSTERLNDNSFPPPDFEPNPVEVALQAIEKPPAKGKPAKRNNAAVTHFGKRSAASGATSGAPMTTPAVVVPMETPSLRR
ncbi:MAG TPA: PEGA domain-containing protein [Xanthobacteraceae bacterium]|nr:PEGA domain-containing protein [Xanthobacteraceae bacterium]